MSMCGQSLRQAPVNGSFLQISYSVVSMFYYDSIMNYEWSPCHNFGLSVEDSGKAES